MIQETRFVVLGSGTMMELVHLMNESVHPLAKLVYFGANGGDYTGYKEEAKLTAAKYIAVFDVMPTPVAIMEDMHIITTLEETTTENDITMSA